jgi:hypothetical protein
MQFGYRKLGQDLVVDDRDSESESRPEDAYSAISDALCQLCHGGGLAQLAERRHEKRPSAGACSVHGVSTPSPRNVRTRSRSR